MLFLALAIFRAQYRLPLTVTPRGSAVRVRQKFASADYPRPQGLHPRIICNRTWYLFPRPRIICIRSQHRRSQRRYGWCRCTPGARNTKQISGLRAPNCTKLAEYTRPSSQLTEFVSELRYLAAFSNVGRSKSSYVENDAKFRTF